MKVDGKVVAEGTVPISAPLIFTANDCLGHWHRARIASVARLFRQGAVQIQRHNRAGSRKVCDGKTVSWFLSSRKKP